MVNRDAQVIQKNKKQYDVRTEHCTLQIFGAKSKQTSMYWVDIELKCLLLFHLKIIS